MAFNDYQWFNQSHPQTLQIGIIILYINTIFGALDLRLFGGMWLLIFFLVSVLLPFLGALGCANEKKWGYAAALAAALSPFVIRLIYGAGLFGVGSLQLIFEIAVVALFLHPMTRNYVKIWFK